MGNLILNGGEPKEAEVGEKLQAPRKPIVLTDSPQISIPLLAEGNKNAENILANMIRMGTQVAILILDLDDMNIRGEQIPLLYNQICGGNTEVFICAIKNRSKAAVRILNTLCPNHRAVIGGASFGRERYEEHYK